MKFWVRKVRFLGVFLHSKMVLLVPSRHPRYQHVFSTPCTFLRPLEKGFNPSGSCLPPAVRSVSPRGTGRGSETSSGFGKAGVFPAPRRGRAGFPLISRLLPAGHRANNLSVLAGQEGGDVHSSPPPLKGRAVRHGGARNPRVLGGTTVAPPGTMGRGWAGGELSTHECWVAHPQCALQEGARNLLEPGGWQSLENWGAV